MKLANAVMQKYSLNNGSEGGYISLQFNGNIVRTTGIKLDGTTEEVAAQLRKLAFAVEALTDAKSEKVG